MDNVADCGHMSRFSDYCIWILNGILLVQGRPTLFMRILVGDI
uniref:Uncharacterized protein n=1 Tax=Arundo donax TaxID=35708 RepID=A0A0A9AY80_ARUDO